MADKARYYLEQSVPELKELEKKKIFDKKEIAIITRKRSEFEHKVNAPGCKPKDYERYVEFEMNLETLRRKRVQRLGIKDRSYAGQRKIFFVFDRATRKFHGDIDLWKRYIDYAKREKASKVLMKVFASALKLHPMRPDLWIYAASYAIEENGDMTEGRSFMQRGLRFNKGSRQLWQEYAKLELVYIAKVITRRKLLGINSTNESSRQTEGLPAVEDEDESMIELPAITAEEVEPNLDRGERSELAALDDLEKNPALNGAIPLAVFDAAMKEIPDDIEFVYSFFNLFAGFPELHCVHKLVEHVAKHAAINFPTSPLGLFMDIRLPLVGIEHSNPAFPSSTASAISRIPTNISKASPRVDLYELVTTSFLQCLQAEDLDPAVGVVITSTLNKYLKQAEREKDINAKLYIAWAKALEVSGKADAAKALIRRGKEAFPESIP